MDFSILREAANGDERFARELADLFQVQTAEELARLRAALARRSATEVHRIAHRCKGSSHTCGAEALALLFDELAHLGHDGHLGQAPKVASEIEVEFARVQRALRSLAGPPP